MRGWGEVKEIHREEMMSKVALMEGKGTASGEKSAGNSEHGVHAGTHVWSRSPCTGPCKLVKGDARIQAHVFCPCRRS